MITALSYVGTLLIGAFLGYLWNAWAMRPRLKVTAYGVGSTVSAQITNMPGYFGLHVAPRKVLGRQLVRHSRMIGFNTDRVTAHGCNATLWIRTTGEPVAHLRWMPLLGEHLSVDHPDLEAAATWNLMMFVNDTQAPTQYYPWEPTEHGGVEPRVPNSKSFGESHQFEVRIQTKFGVGLLAFPIDVEVVPGGGRNYTINNGRPIAR